MHKQQNDMSAGAETRRSFLRKTATATVAVAATGLVKPSVFGQAPSANVLGANSKIVLGFIGLGNQGFGSHLKPMKESSGENNLAIAGVCDVSKFRRAQAKETVGGDCKDYEDYHKLLEDKSIDAIVCATVDHWHARVSLDALRAGKHVYVEKPMCRYLGEAFEIYDTVKSTGKILQVGSQGTSDLKWHKAAEVIKAGKIGPVVMSQGSYMRNTPKGEWNYSILPWATKDDVNWNLWVGDQIKTRKAEFDVDDYFRWRKYYRYCAGLLGDLFPHKLHPYMLATGNPEFPTRVSAIGTRKVETDKKTPGTPMRDVPEIIQLIAEFPSGMVMHITSSSVNEQGTQEMIRGQKGSLYLGGNKVDLKPEKPFTEEIDPESFGPFPAESIPAHHKNWFGAIRGTEKGNCSVDLAVRVQTVVSLGEMSDRLGMMCHFDEKTRKITDGAGKEIQAITYGWKDGLS
ncbi:MAG: Gfo/Idh/MocA family oxidoreductase [Verrucomicrobiota bacterium]